MDAEINTERSTVFLAVVTLMIVGLGLVLGLWQIIQRQEEAMREHLMLASRSVLQAVESTLWRGYFATPGNDYNPEITPETADFFRELEQSGDVIFVSIMDSTGEKIIASLPGPSSGEIHFEPDILTQIVEKGEWGGYMTVSRKEAYAYVRRVNHPAGVKLPKNMELSYLVVAFDVAKHQLAYKGFKQNLQFQTIYILLAALVVWILAISFLKRRALAGRAVVLERFQATLLDSLPDGLILLDENSKIEAANPAAHKVLQIPLGSLVGRTTKTLPREVSDSLQLNRVPSGGAWRHCILGGAHLEILVQPLSSSENAGDQSLILIRDRTEIRELEKSLYDAEKLATVGTLAAGMAHEIRNPLSALRGFAQYFAKKFAGKEPEEKYAQTMVLEADRLNRVISDLLDLARPKHVEPRMLSLNDIVESLKMLINFDLEKSGVQLKCDLEVAEAFADEDSLKRALLNLIINSLEALDGGGEQNRDIELLSHSGDGGVWLTVRDYGSGMTDEQKEQAFEPFYTGKPKGTGLGLALVHKTMREHNGKITLDSASGKGTTISLFFPGYTAGADRSN